MNQEKIAQAAAILRNAKHIVAMTGAGISRPSGIPDFRSESGLWSKDDPMEAVSIRSFRKDPQRFYNWLRPLLELTLKAAPNPAHLALAKLEHNGLLQAVITQNIDNLHQQAGSKTVYELHGHMHGATCFHCGKNVAFAPLIDTILQGSTPRCNCGGPFKPDIVFFGEALPEEAFTLSQHTLETCDALIVAGTSLVVYPAAQLPWVAVQNRARIIIVNMSETDLDQFADVVLHEDVASALPAIVAAMEKKNEKGAAL